MCNNNNGYIKMSRGILESTVFKNPKYLQVWLYVLASVSYKKRTVYFNGSDIEIPEGAFITGRKSICNDTGQTEQNIKTALRYLKVTNRITIQVTNRYSIIQVQNWEKYQTGNQPTNQPSNQQVTNSQPTSNQEVTTNKKVKESIESKEREKDIHEENSLYVEKMVWEFKNSKQELKKVVDPFEDLENHNPSGQGATVFNDIFHNKWPKDKRGNYKEAEKAFYRHYDLSEGFKDLYSAIDHYKQTKTFKEGVVMKVSTFLSEWDNFKPNEQETVKEKEVCKICNDKKYWHINAPGRDGTYYSVTDSYIYSIDCMCVSSKSKFESLIGVPISEYLSSESKITEEFKKNISHELKLCT